MAAEAEASRDARAKVIAAEGEMKASYLQTLTQIAAERNSTIVFPVPVELLQLMSRNKR
jgi:erythrocyte band 7 integral membrane protein